MLDARRRTWSPRWTPRRPTRCWPRRPEGDGDRRKTVKHNFAWMRPNDLVYSYVVNDWLLGNDAPAFDVLAWNDDATNLSATFSLDSNAMVTSGKVISPGRYLVPRHADRSVQGHLRCFPGRRVARPHHHLAAVLHDQPAARRRYRGGDLNSGHIQTFVNPAGKSRYKYWWGPAGGPDPDAWLVQAECTTGRGGRDGRNGS